MIHIENPSGNKIKQLNTDPTSPKAEDAWVLREGTGGGIIQLSTQGVPMGLLMALTYATTETTTGVAFTYKFSYRTKEGTTQRVLIN
jgi:hypothetical protein